MNIWPFRRVDPEPAARAAVRAAIMPLGMNLEMISVKEGVASVVVAAGSAAVEGVEDQIRDRLLAVRGIRDVRVVITAERAVAGDTSAPDHGPAIHIKGAGRRAPMVMGGLAAGVTHLIAVASGKGGVGKSTVAVNLAVAMAQASVKVGLLDADIYGPSVPMMMGIAGQKPVLGADKKLQPIMAHGVACMSMGMLVDNNAPMIWRGPMVQTAIVQLLRDVDWSGVDVLIIDLPPGTGDAQLTMAQKIKLTGAIIVSTPQDVALLDARKGLEMFRKTGVPILGIVENMSVFCCPSCGHQSSIFGAGGVRDLAAHEGVPFLGALPLDAAVRERGDAGAPVPGAAIKQMATNLLLTLAPVRNQ